MYAHSLYDVKDPKAGAVLHRRAYIGGQVLALGDVQQFRVKSGSRFHEAFGGA